MKAATLYATKAGQTLIKNLAEVIKADSEPERMVELAGIGKIALEEGPKIATIAVEKVADNHQIVAQSSKNLVQTMQESTIGAWSIPDGGRMINGRWYTQHALERMAPDTIHVRAILERRALKLGLQRGSKDFRDYVNPRGIPPSIVEETIKNGIKKNGKKAGTTEFKGDAITVFINELSGAVITIIPK